MTNAEKTVHRFDLQVGDRVVAPATVRQGGAWVPLADVWPEHPPVLVVRLWSVEDGETMLANPDGRGYLDLNVCDYPETMERA